VVPGRPGCAWSCLCAHSLGPLPPFLPAGLDKNIIGELLGDPDPFYLNVLDMFTGTFRSVLARCAACKARHVCRCECRGRHYRGAYCRRKGPLRGAALAPLPALSQVQGPGV
jgi:hypothetical protein